MGKEQSKLELEGDAKYMNQHYPGSVNWLNKWGKPPYMFNGRLNPTKCSAVVELVKTDIKKNKKRNPDMDAELAAAIKWLEQSKRRKEEVDRSKTRRKEAYATLVGPDDETTAVVRKRPTEAGDAAKGGRMGARGSEKRSDKQQTGRGAEGVQSGASFSPLHTRAGRKTTEVKPAEVKTLHAQAAAPPGLYPSLEEQKDQYDDCEECGPVPTYPLVEVANPHFDPQQPRGAGNNPVMRVYRPWTESDLHEACKGLGSATEEPNKWTENHAQLVTSYGLNGWEINRTFLTCLGFHWGRVRGNFTGKGQDGQWLPAGTPELKAQTEGVYGRVRTTWRQRPDYGKINQCKQGNEESVEEYRGRLEQAFIKHCGLPEDSAPESPFQQQLKMSFLQGLRPELSHFIRKHDVNYPTDGMPQVMNWARHAQDVIKKKKRKTTEVWAETFGLLGIDESEEEEVYYYGQQGGAQGSRGGFRRGMGYRGRGRGGRGPRGDPEITDVMRVEKKDIS